MTPKEKAKELFYKFNNIRQHTLICVDEIVKAQGKEICMNDFDYWQEVKKEIENL